MALAELQKEVIGILMKWEKEHLSEKYNPTATLVRLSEIFETQTVRCQKKDPKWIPLEIYHPTRPHEDCHLARILPILMKKQNFLTKMVSEYLQEKPLESSSANILRLHVAVLRLILNIFPNMDLSITLYSTVDDIIRRIFSWAENSTGPLQIYATGFIAALMNVKNTAERFHKENEKLLPIMMQRLHKLHNQAKKDTSVNLERENPIKIYPSTLATHQMFILHYLAVISPKNEFRHQISKNEILELLLKFMNGQETKDIRLTFEALKYLGDILIFKELISDFGKMGGLQKLILFLPRPDVVRIRECLDGDVDDAPYIDPMEGITFLPKHIIQSLIRCAVIMLEQCPNDKLTIYHIAKFFLYALPFKYILEEFDAQNCLKHLLEIISRFLRLREKREDDGTCPCELTMMNAICALRRYLESHLSMKVEELEPKKSDKEIDKKYGSCLCRKKFKINADEVQEKVEICQKLMDTKSVWKPVEEILNLGGITNILKIIDSCYEKSKFFSNIPAHTFEEILRSCLDILAICSLDPKVMLKFCKSLDHPECPTRLGMELFFDAVDSRMTINVGVRKAALRVIGNCLCSPINEIEGKVVKKNIYNSKKFMENIWQCARSCDGIRSILLSLMNDDSIRSADSIRALACRALYGLSRCEKVQQILNKLPLFADECINMLMENPVSRERQKEHAIFRKYASQILSKLPKIDKTRQSINEEKLDEKQTQRQFNQVKTFKPSDKQKFTYCTFSSCQEYLMIGTQLGDLKILNINSGVNEKTYHCHKTRDINYIECHRNGNLILTSTSEMSFGGCGSYLWSINPKLDTKISFDIEHNVEFSKHQDKIIGNQVDTAFIYDIATGKVLKEFCGFSRRNWSHKNKATFSIDDKMVMSDGILWDYNSEKKIHMFDKFNVNLGGVFHPNGNEVIMDVEVWDLRTFQLLNYVTDLDQREVIFSPVNDIIYAVQYSEPDNPTYNSTFDVFNSCNYEFLTSKNIKSDIWSLSCNKLNTQIAIVENQGKLKNLKNSCVRIYDVGKD